jgi:hypothetical protein
MINLNLLRDATTTATNLSNVVLVTPEKNNEYVPQPNSSSSANLNITQLSNIGYLFDYEGENSIVLESDITDHYTEDNLALQDQIALKPVIVNVKGYIGELNNVTPPALQKLKFAAEKLTTINAYLPVLSASAIVAYNNAFLIYSVASHTTAAAISAWSSINNIKNTNGTLENVQTKQANKFNQFCAFWKSRTLLTIQTPWRKFENMAIKSLRATQDAETRMISDFEISFKQMRFVVSQVQTIKKNVPNKQGRNIIQSSPLTEFPVFSPSVTSPFNTTVNSNFGVTIP